MSPTDAAQPRSPEPAPQPPTSQLAIPLEVRLADQGRSLELVWSEHEVDRLTASQMRAACRCAWCTLSRRQGLFPDAFPPLSVTRLQPLGNLSAHIVFSDGHDRGLFPWAYLRTVARGGA